MDFTIHNYKLLLQTLNENYTIQSFDDFIKTPLKESVILRHDVDRLPRNSLHFAKIQAALGIRGSYYFRAVPCSWNENIILEIKALGHEVGYHYENMDTCRGNIDKAWDDFRYNLDKLRKLVEVKTICMHGSPLSPYDNKELWKKYDYRSLGIIGEPYFDIDFDKVFYLTDTGRGWSGWKSSIRDKVPQQERWIKQGLVFRSTNDVIQATRQGQMPDQVMFTFHPQRWNDKAGPWLKELVFQELKNVMKKVLVRRDSKRRGD
jgi:hypothetical protein